MTFKPGQSGNPRGRPKGAKRLAKYIAEKTDDGRKMIDFACRLLDSDELDIRDREWACDFLTNRMVGRPVAPTELDIEVHHSASFDLSRLSEGELDLIGKLIDRAKGKGSLPVIDVKELEE